MFWPRQYCIHVSQVSRWAAFTSIWSTYTDYRPDSKRCHKNISFSRRAGRLRSSIGAIVVTPSAYFSSGGRLYTSTVARALNNVCQPPLLEVSSTGSLPHSQTKYLSQIRFYSNCSNRGKNGDTTNNGNKDKTDLGTGKKGTWVDPPPSSSRMYVICQHRRLRSSASQH